MNLREIWTELELGGGQPREGILRRRIFPDSRCDLFVGVQHPACSRLLLIRVGKKVAGLVTELPRARGCEIGKMQLPDDPPDQISFWLLLKDNRYADVFTSLVEDVARSLSRVTDDAALIETLIARLQQWQSFLDRQSPEGLSEEAQRGLFGELTFLKDKLIPELGTRRSVRAWKGPARAAHDFQFTTLSVEIKTTISKQHEKLLITSERQLDTANLQRLLLVHFSLDPLLSGGMTLPEIVAAVREDLASDVFSRDLLEDLLRDSGYLDAHASRYDERHYAVRKIEVFEVRPGFPRLTEKDLPPGVGDLSYTIIVAQCLPFSLSDSQTRQLLLETADGQ
jgi:hypothetical protein